MPTGNSGRAAASVRAPPATSNGEMSCVTSTRRTSGAIERITPRQIATHGSRVPKSVSSEISGVIRDMMPGWRGTIRLLRPDGLAAPGPADVRRSGGGLATNGLRARSRAVVRTGATLAAFRIPGYRALWGAGTAAGFGWSVSLVAISWVTLEVSNSP